MGESGTHSAAATIHGVLCWSGPLLCDNPMDCDLSGDCADSQPGAKVPTKATVVVLDRLRGRRAGVLAHGEKAGGDVRHVGRPREDPPNSAPIYDDACDVGG